MKTLILTLAILCGGLAPHGSAHAGAAVSAVRETAEAILGRFGKGVAGASVDEIAEATTKAVVRHGDDALPFLRRAGHTGFEALNQAGGQAPEVIRLYARKGDEAIWLISEPKRLNIFLKHGDSAADALLKHRGISDELIGQYGSNGVGALNAISREGGQRLGIVAREGLLTANPRSAELLPVIRLYGDEAMDFIWKNKGALAVASVLATFVADPKVYLSGARQLIVDPIVGPIMNGSIWTLIILAMLAIKFWPWIHRSITTARMANQAKVKKLAMKN